MRLFDEDGEDLLAFVDTLFNVAFIFLCMFVLSIMQPHLKAEETAKRDGITAGRMCVELFWPDNLDIDLDLWGRGPDNKVIGYSSRSGPLMDLLRDDLGFYNDPSGRNFETMCSRELRKGEWTFNVHYYGPHQVPEPIDVPVTVVVSFPVDSSSPAKQQPVTVKAVVHAVGEQQTLIDFDLDGTGHIVPGSVNHVDQPLRTNKGADNGR